MRRSLRLASGLVLFTYITAHLVNHALGLVSLKTAEAGLEFAVEVWSSPPGTVLLYGAFAIHFVLALWSVYERRTFRLPPLELLRIALGFTLPILLIGHAANTRLAWELFGMPSDYARVVANLWFADAQGTQLGVMAPGWVHGCLGLHFLLNRRPLYRKLRYVLFAFALLIPVFSGLGIHRHGAGAGGQCRRGRRGGGLSRARARRRAPGAGAMAQRAAARIFRHHRRDLRRARGAQRARTRPPPPGHDLVSRAAPCACRAAGRCWKRAAASTSRTPRCAAGARAARPAGCGSARARRPVRPRPPTSARHSSGSARRPTCASPASCARRATCR